MQCREGPDDGHDEDDSDMDGDDKDDSDEGDHDEDDSHQDEDDYDDVYWLQSWREVITDLILVVINKFGSLYSYSLDNTDTRGRGGEVA